MRVCIAWALGALVLATAPAHAESHLIVANGIDISSGDAQRIAGGGERIFFSQTFEGLYGHDNAGKVTPELALSHTVTPDGKVYVFKLRPGVTWHNGDPFTAADVVFSWKRGIDPKTFNPGAGVILANMASVEAVDDLTVRITLKQPDASLLENLGDNFLLVPKKYLEAVGNEEFGRKPIGTGPWKLVDRQIKQYMTFLPNTAHWGHVPTVDKLTIKVVPDTQTRVAMLKTGEADIVTALPAHLVKEIDASPDTRVVRIPTYQNIFIQISTGRADKRWNKDARLALNHAIDRKTLVDKLMFGAAKVSASFCGEGILGCDIGQPPYAYDPKLAKELLAKSGLDLSKAYRFVGLAPGRTPQSKEVAEAISQYFQRVGLKTRLDVMEYGAWLAYIKMHAYDESDLTFFTFTDYNNDPMARLPRALSTTGSSSYNVDPELDAMLEKANAIVDPEAREEYLRSIFRRLYDDPPVIPLWTVDELYGVRRNVEWSTRKNISWPLLWQVTKK
jgi:peptide/nickel transport system substrate-binding protein